MVTINSTNIADAKRKLAWKKVAVVINEMVFTISKTEVIQTLSNYNASTITLTEATDRIHDFFITSVSHPERNSLLELAKKLDLQDERAYFDYIVESILNGQREQAITLFEDMEICYRKGFLHFVLSETMLAKDKEKIMTLCINLL